MIRRCAVAFLVAGVVFSFPHFARGEDAAVPLAELDRLRVQVLVLERDLIAQRFATVKAQADFAFAEKHAALTTLAREIAERDGFDLAAWELDVKTFAWRPKKETP